MKIEIVDVEFSYAKKTKSVLNGINLSMSTGSCYVLQGANGSGKTTLSKLICGLIKPKSGAIIIDGADIRKTRVARIANRIGYLFQNAEMQLFATSVLEELTFPYELAGTLTAKIEEKIEAVLKDFGLSNMKDRFPLLMSGGEKQRLALAGIAGRNVEFLVLDGPTSSIDDDGKRFLTEYVNNFVKLGGGALVITHDDDFAKTLENRVILQTDNGKVLEK